METKWGAACVRWKRNGVRRALYGNSCVNLEIPDFDFGHLYENKTYNVKRGRFSDGLSIYYKKHIYPSILRSLKKSKTE